ncbi:MAG TPA: flagellar motor switch protein FliN [Burkholderiales bacterium]|nr:flagellar motor switch protein FliN [Pseudomonadota bacterium]HVC49372.1 flagellar motor switch protein FliN [Burkholderiales bacterium]
MAEQNESISADDWAAALNEQSTSEATPKVSSSQTQPVSDTQSANVFSSLQETASMGVGAHSLEMVLDIPVTLTVEMGKTRIPIRNLLQLAQGSVVELDGQAGEPMNVLINGRLIAQGEVVVINDKFGIRLTDIIEPSQRMKK